MSEQNSAASASVNRAKPYQLMLFPLNNGATNVYYVLVLSYIATFGSKVLALSMIFASVMVTGMRLFDAITDPIIGALMDRTNGKFGKFRPFMVIGNLIMAVSILVLYGLTPLIPASMEWARYVAFVALYAIWVIGYTFQTSCTRSGQTVLTNDPKQRPLFTIFNTVGSLLGMGAMQFFAPILAKNYEGGYASAGFFRTLAPVGIVISIALTILAVIGIWEKDQPKYFGIGGQKTEKIKVAEYVAIIKGNNPMQRLMVAGAGCKLALSIATNTTVLCMLYGCMMGNYDGLYLPMMVLGYVFSVPFFLLTVRTSQKKGQKASLMRYVSVALICYIGVLVLLLLWGKGDAFTLSLMSDGKVSINVYTILFIALFGIGYGAYYATADMPIPMVADCSDYETYISGKYIPGIMGTLFSLVDKLVSSLSATVVGVAVSFIGLDSLPTQYDPYTPGMNVVVIVLFCVIPMMAWAATLLAMKNYSLTGEKMKEIQAVNACRRDAVAGGMKLEDAMAKWQTIDQLCRKALSDYGGKLPTPVHFIFDEFANIGTIPQIEETIAVTRSRNIGITIILQSMSQLESKYDKKAQTIIDCCDSTLFLGGKSNSTNKEIAEMIGKQTIHQMTYNESTGQSSSASKNLQIQGRDLIDAAEIGKMSRLKAILLIAGTNPLMDDKYDPHAHKRYRYIVDKRNWKRLHKNSFDFERYLKNGCEPYTPDEDTGAEFTAWKWAAWKKSRKGLLGKLLNR